MSAVAEIRVPARPEAVDVPKAARMHAVAWFEIPVTDMTRAQFFYEFLLCAPLRRETIGGNSLAIFSHGQTGVGGCLLDGATAPEPSENGALVYLNAGESLDEVLARVNAAGGRIATPRTDLPGDMGCYAHIIDSEGNRIGLHAPR